MVSCSSHLRSGSSEWKTTSDYVRRALETYGCLVVSYKDGCGPSESVRNAVFRQSAEKLFSLPIETKVKHRSDVAGFGYGGNFSKMPLFEYFGIHHDEGVVEGVGDFAKLMCLDSDAEFCLETYCKWLVDLNHTMLKMATSSYKAEYSKHLIERSVYMTRIMKYRADETGIGLLPHRDKSFLAALSANEVKGLQIETRGGEWIHYEPSPSKFVIIVGEPFMAWSNGRIYSPLHTVMIEKEVPVQDRYSIGVFSFIRGILQVPEGLIDHDHPLRFKPFSNFEFLQHCKDGGNSLPAAIHDYCGI